MAVASKIRVIFIGIPVFIDKILLNKLAKDSKKLKFRQQGIIIIFNPPSHSC